MQPSGGFTERQIASLVKWDELLPPKSGTTYGKCKCMPILLHGFEVLNKYQLNSLDFVANRFLMKLFNTSNMQTI